jgi:hypothetical protein
MSYRHSAISFQPAQQRSERQAAEHAERSLETAGSPVRFSVNKRARTWRESKIFDRLAKAPSIKGLDRSSAYGRALQIWLRLCRSVSSATSVLSKAGEDAAARDLAAALLLMCSSALLLNIRVFAGRDDSAPLMPPRASGQKADRWKLIADRLRRSRTAPLCRCGEICFRASLRRPRFALRPSVRLAPDGLRS